MKVTISDASAVGEFHVQCTKATNLMLLPEVSPRTGGRLRIRPSLHTNVGHDLLIRNPSSHRVNGPIS